MMAKWIILTLIRRKLKLRKCETFQFTNQKTDNLYCIDDYGVWKLIPMKHDYKMEPSNVSLNWLLSFNCKIVKVRREQ